MLFETNDKVVFAGDSVTDMGRAYPYGDGLGEGIGKSYVQVVRNMIETVYPERNINVINMGISGNTSRDLLARFDNDVCALNPDWVSICIGINDVWRQFDRPTQPETWVLPDEYEQNLIQMIEKIKDKVKGIFILSPYYMEPQREDLMRARMDEYTAVCKKLAEKYGCIFVDFQQMYENYFGASGARHSSAVAWDRVHPNMVGATLMAMNVLSAAEFEFDRLDRFKA